MAKFGDLIKETSVSAGTGDMILDGPKDDFLAFSSRIAAFDNVFYSILNLASGEYETGRGRFRTGPDRIERTTVLSSSNADALVSFAGVEKEVIQVQPAVVMEYFDIKSRLTTPPLSNGIGSIAIGENAKASNNFAAAIGGKDNSASNEYSIALGFGARAGAYAELANSAGEIEANAISQKSIVQWRNLTTGAQSVDLFLDGAVQTFRVPDNTLVGFLIRIVGLDKAMGEFWHSVHEGTIVNNQQTSSIIGTVSETIIGSTAGLGAVAISITAQAVNNELIVNVTGVAGINMNWLAVADMAMVGTFIPD